MPEAIDMTLELLLALALVFGGMNWGPALLQDPLAGADSQPDPVTLDAPVDAPDPEAHGIEHRNCQAITAGVIYRDLSCMALFAPETSTAHPTPPDPCPRK